MTEQITREWLRAVLACEEADPITRRLSHRGGGEIPTADVLRAHIALLDERDGLAEQVENWKDDAKGTEKSHASLVREIARLRARLSKLEKVAEAAKAMEFVEGRGLRFGGAGEYGGGVFITPETEALAASLRELEGEA